MGSMVGIGQKGSFMTSADSMRASDADREKVIQALQEQVGTGRLTLAEFEQRSAEANAAVTIGDLRKLTADLPIDPFPQPTQQIPGWPTPTPMPPQPPWANQNWGNQWWGNRLANRPSPMMLAVGVGFGIMVLVALAAVLTVGRIAFPIVPLFFVLFLILRRRGPGPGRRYRR